jgi:hypothetical protein
LTVLAGTGGQHQWAVPISLDLRERVVAAMIADRGQAATSSAAATDALSGLYILSRPA